MKQKIEFMGKQKIELMGHVVAGYPTIYSCLGAATGILKGGANFLEVQFPFSDGNADGILIQEASDYSLKHGFIPKHGFTIIEALVRNTSKNIIAMTYANIIFRYGIENFIRNLKDSGGYGLIIPDLIYGQEDFGVRSLCHQYDICFIELIAPLTSYKRVKEIAMQTKSPFVYVIARNGLTGQQTQIDSEVLEYIQNIVEICALESKHVMVGFGINNAQQIALLTNKVYGVVVGSYFVDIINQNIESSDLIPILQNATQKLLQIDS